MVVVEFREDQEAESRPCLGQGHTRSHISTRLGAGEASHKVTDNLTLSLREQGEREWVKYHEKDHNSIYLISISIQLC